MKQHLSEQLLDEIQKAQFNAGDDKQLVHIIREYFCKVHKQAVEDTVIAYNRKTGFERPQFYDK